MGTSFPLFPPRDRKPNPTPESVEAALLMETRRQLLNQLHMGTLQPGDRLPSIRQKARETGADHRTVAAIYRALEDEGLVEVRGRSGVRVAERQVKIAEREREGWLAGILAEGWGQGVASGTLQSLLSQGTAGSGLRCLCVESNEDQMLAYCHELGELTGMEMQSLYLSEEDCGAVRDEQVKERLMQAIAAADIVVTTEYHAMAVRRMIGEQGPPLVVLRINPQLANAVRTRLAAGTLTVVAVSQEFGKRLRLMYADTIRDPSQIRVVIADRIANGEGLDPREPVLLTRAARQRLSRRIPRRLVFPHSPTIAPETLQELAAAVVRRNLAEARQS